MSQPPPMVKHSGVNTTFTGIRHRISSSENEVWQFRGIKYASIPGRFRQSTLNTSFEKETDTTRYGPKCPQPPQNVHLEDSLIALPTSITTHQPNVFSEFNCLNLNITAPAGAKAGDNLPVLVYIHGGGGFSGSNSDWWCDGGSVVKRSMEIGKPIIMVAVNYRLSVFGYMASEEMASINGPDNAANFGPRDVHTALTWLSHHISSFGGSPNNIVPYGESHGSVLIETLLHCTPPPPISRAIMQSQTLRTPIFTPTLTLASSNTLYNATKSALGVTTLSELETIPWEQLLTAYATSDPRNGFGHVPIIDDTFFPSDFASNFTFKGDLILGTTGKESAVISCVAANFPTISPKPFTSALLSTLYEIFPPAEVQSTPSKIAPILTAYNLTPTTPPSLAAETILNIIEDLVFYHPSHTLSILARQHGITINEYSFEQRQPFGGAFKGVPAHALDLAYLHGDPSIFDGTEDPEGERGMQRGLQDSWIRFAWGEGWSRSGNGGKDIVRRFGPDGKVVDEDKPSFLREWRRKNKWDVIMHTLDEAEREVFLGTCIGHLVQLLGTERPAPVTGT
ncbi:Alpha/Beta hydrolase protein [Cadophora sp. MPI-SDFR-AT-0126]|nr:Alpha/Beta hydrolase protein [Leotiomycetes sp. MPI-SDFR-AT-0126]